jgi:hypothetical protein
MSGHTPGPWRADEKVVRGPGGIPIALLATVDAESNARLIAAAPDLLEILQALAPLIDSVDQLLGSRAGTSLGEKVRSAIARAEGRS